MISLNNMWIFIPQCWPCEIIWRGGGIGADIPGTTLTYGVVNYTMSNLLKRTLSPFAMRFGGMKMESVVIFLAHIPVMPLD